MLDLRLEVLELLLVLVVRQRLQRLFVELVEVAGVAGALRPRHVRWRHLYTGEQVRVYIYLTRRFIREDLSVFLHRKYTVRNREIEVYQ